MPSRNGSAAVLRPPFSSFPAQSNRTVNVLLPEYVEGKYLHILFPSDIVKNMCYKHKDAIVDAAICLHFDMLERSTGNNVMQPGMLSWGRRNWYWGRETAPHRGDHCFLWRIVTTTSGYGGIWRSDSPLRQEEDIRVCKFAISRKLIRE